MDERGDTTRTKLLDAATDLFATRGMANVTLAEITARAGQRNTSALHYYFGNRDGLVRELVQEHVPRIRDRRSALLQLARKTPGDVRSAAEAVVLPHGELLLGDWRTKAFARIASDLLSSSSRRELDPLLGDTLLFESELLLVRRLPNLPSAMRQLRSQVAGMMITHATSDYAVRLDRHSDRHHNVVLFIFNLVDMYLASVCTPPSTSSLSQLKITGGSRAT